MEQLWTSVEDEFSAFQVRMHRASISLVEDEDIEESDWEEKEHRRSAALFQFYTRSAISSIIALTGVSIGTWVLVQNPSGESLYGGLLSIILTPIPFSKQLHTFLKDILPTLRGGPKQLLQKAMQDAMIGEDFDRRDFSQDMGFMGEVKKEAEYLFDFLRVNKYYDQDKKTLHPVRMSIFVDDLDRCKAKTVVSVLEAVFLLLSESPIICYLAIDTRLVVASIDEHYTVHDRAGINGYDFLEKIVQLPFCIPDLPEKKKRLFMNRLFFNGQLDAIKLCEAIKTLRTHGHFPEVDKLEISANYNNSSENAMRVLVNAFSANSKVKAFVNSTKDLETVEDILKADKSEQESFLYTIASILQQIQESSNTLSLNTPSENKEEMTSVLGVSQDVEKSPTIDAEEKLPSNGRMEATEISDTIEDDVSEQSKIEEKAKQEMVTNDHPLDEEKGSSNFSPLVELTSIEEEKVLSNSKTPAESNSVKEEEEAHGSEDTLPIEELEALAPFASMVTPEEREWFEEFAPFMVGKARSINRVINVYNLARDVAKKLVSNSDAQFQRKLMKLIVLAEFWPYRTAFLMQVAEDIVQLRSVTKSLNENDRIYDVVDGYRINEILPKILVDSCEEDQENISLSTLYNCVVERLLYSSKKEDDALKMLARDNDPQLFESLLSNSKRELDDLLCVKDLIVPIDMEATSSCLRLLTLNMSRHMLEFSSRCLDNLIFFVEPSIDIRGKPLETLKYKFKDEYYRSCSAETSLEENTKSYGGKNATGPTKQEPSGVVVTNQTKLKSNSEPLVVEVQDEMGIVHQWISFENEDDKKKEIGALIEDPSKYGSIVKINNRKKVSWYAIKDMPFSKVQKLCGDGSPIEIIQFFHEASMVSTSFKESMK